VVFYRFSRDEVTAECGRLHNEEFRGLYFLTKCYSGFQIKNNKMRGACGTNGGDKEVHMGFGG